MFALRDWGGGGVERGDDAAGSLAMPGDSLAGMAGRPPSILKF
jgi:hypothetical protein